jgi:protein TonB
MSASLSAFDVRFPEQGSRIGSLALVVLAHVGLFYALSSGLKQFPAMQVPPKEVVATFITPEPAPVPAQPQPKPKPEPAKPKAQQPKPAPAVPRPVPREIPVQTVEQTAPSPTAITAPQPAPAPATPAAPAPAAPPQPKTVTTGIEYIQPPKPDYPPASRRSGEEGKTMLRVLVNERGRPERVEVQKSSGYPRLDEAARQAASRSLFKPFMEDGKAVAAYVIVPINFQLD